MGLLRNTAVKTIAWKQDAMMRHRGRIITGVLVIGCAMAWEHAADAAPSPDAQTGYTKLAALTDATLHAWDDFKRSDLATLNAALHAAHAKPIDLRPAK